MSDLGQSGGRDICSDCGKEGTLGTDLLRCGRHGDGDWLVIQLCIDCLHRVNPYMQADLINSAFEDVSDA